MNTNTDLRGTIISYSLRIILGVVLLLYIFSIYSFNKRPTIVKVSLATPFPQETDNFLPIETPAPTEKEQQEDQIIPQALVYIACGPKASQFQTHLAVKTARLRGKWQKDIYILTDRPGCFGSLDATIIKVEARGTPMEIKKYKTEIFSLLPANISKVIYCDTDIFIGKELAAFEDLVANFTGRWPETQLFTFPEEDAFHSNALEKYHGGLLVIGRKKSEQCLNRWRRTFAMYKRDQIPLGSLAAEGKCDITRLPNWMVKPNGENASKIGVFNHLTGARIQRIQKEFLAEWLYNVIGKPSAKELIESYPEFLGQLADPQHESAPAMFLAGLIFNALTTATYPCKPSSVVVK